MSALTSVARSAAAAAGAALAGGTRALAAGRGAVKPLHPKGVVRHATLHRHGLEPPLGVAFLDRSGTDEVLVRESRAAGLPSPLPDVHGLALRVLGADGAAGDVLFSTNGFGRLARFLLVPTRTTYGRPMTTLLPYDTVAGPVLLGVQAVEQDRLEVSFAVGTGEWRPFGVLELSDRESDEDLSFDPVRNTLPGLAQYAAVRRLREPAYATARASREADARDVADQPARETSPDGAEP